MRFLYIFVFFISNLCFSQAPIKIGDRTIKPEFLDSTKFNLFGTWKVIYRTYVAEREHTYEILPLEEINTNLYEQRKIQGELIYGSYVVFSDSLYMPFSSYLPHLILNPRYKKVYSEVIAKNGESDPRWGNQNLLMINVICPIYANKNAQVEFSVFVFKKDLVAIIYNNSITFLERVKDTLEAKNTWKTDQKGYNYIELMGSTDFSLIIPNQFRRLPYVLSLRYNILNDSGIKYNYIDNKINNRCDNRKTNVIFTTRDKKVVYPLITKISLDELESNILEINIGTKDQLTRWSLYWKVEKQSLNTARKISTTKSFIYSSINPLVQTKMYLIKDDQVEVLDEKGEWLKIRYSGKKVIEGWIKKGDVE